MNEELTPQKERYLREVEQKLLHRELDARLLDDGLIHVRWNEQPLCSVDRDGIVRFRPADIMGPDVDKLIEGQTLKKAKKWELYGKLTPKEYTVTATLFLNDTNTGIKKSVVGLYDTDIDFDGLKAALKTAALEADKLNKPNQEKIDIEICVNNPSKAPFTATTYGQAGYEWREMQHPKDNPVKKWTVAYTWAHVYTYYDVTFDTTVEGLTVPKQTSLLQNLIAFDQPGGIVGVGINIAGELHVVHNFGCRGRGVAKPTGADIGRQTVRGQRI